MSHRNGLIDRNLPFAPRRFTDAVGENCFSVPLIGTRFCQTRAVMSNGKFSAFLIVHSSFKASAPRVGSSVRVSERGAWEAASGSFLPSPSSCSLRPCSLTPLVFAFRFPPSGFRFQLRVSCPGVGIKLGHGENLVAGLFNRVFHPQPVERRALGLLLAGTGFGQAPNEMASNRRSALFHL